MAPQAKARPLGQAQEPSRYGRGLLPLRSEALAAQRLLHDAPARRWTIEALAGEEHLSPRQLTGVLSAPRTTRSSNSTSTRSQRCCRSRSVSRTSTRGWARYGSARTCRSGSPCGTSLRSEDVRVEDPLPGHLGNPRRSTAVPLHLGLGARPDALRPASPRPSWSSARCSSTTRKGHRRQGVSGAESGPGSYHESPALPPKAATCPTRPSHYSS